MGYNCVGRDGRKAPWQEERQKKGGRNTKNVYIGQWVCHAAWGRVQHEDGRRSEWRPRAEAFSTRSPVPHSTQHDAQKTEGAPAVLLQTLINWCYIGLVIGMTE